MPPDSGNLYEPQAVSRLLAVIEQKRQQYKARHFTEEQIETLLEPEVSFCQQIKEDFQALEGFHE
jgi:hypothetical protein